MHLNAMSKGDKSTDIEHVLPPTNTASGYPSEDDYFTNKYAVRRYKGGGLGVFIAQFISKRSSWSLK